MTEQPLGPIHMTYWFSKMRKVKLEQGLDFSTASEIQCPSHWVSSPGMKSMLFVLDSESENPIQISFEKTKPVEMTLDENNKCFIYHGVFLMNIVHGKE